MLGGCNGKLNTPLHFSVLPITCSALLCYTVTAIMEVKIKRLQTEIMRLQFYLSEIYHKEMSNFYDKAAKQNSF